MHKPLEGVKILDLTWVYSGPYATLLLQDLGAEIVKVEMPGVGDKTRYFPPLKNQESGYFYMLNRDKKSIALDLKKHEDQQVFKQLVKNFDVVVENFLPGTMDKMNIGYDSLKMENASLIYASISGFGSFGPYAQFPCIDPIAQALGGLMSLTGEKGGTPQKTGPGITDGISGIYLALGIVSALYQRMGSGEGQQIEVSMLESTVSVLEDAVIRASMTRETLETKGNTDPFGAPWDAFKTKDNKWVMVCALGSKQFETCFRLIGREDLAEEFAGETEDAYEKRSQQLERLNTVFGKWVIQQTAQQTMDILQKEGILIGDVKTVNDLLIDPHLIERKMISTLKHDALGTIQVANSPILFNGQRYCSTTKEHVVSSKIGEHTEEILQQYLGDTIINRKDKEMVEE
ncbi:CaiB/BaiF CoA transferase family protein [Psychrobacillus sp. NPDC093180]|uniref:CaiB/BaiF CoA transferase family protein n=1 Tax=Psychrobacillus sp. NPDC093180 TaxID=3364489 RepID=UPI0037F42F84